SPRAQAIGHSTKLSDRRDARFAPSDAFLLRALLPGPDGLATPARRHLVRFLPLRLRPNQVRRAGARAATHGFCLRRLTHIDERALQRARRKSRQGRAQLVARTSKVTRHRLGLHFSCMTKAAPERPRPDEVSRKKAARAAKAVTPSR